MRQTSITNEPRQLFTPFSKAIREKQAKARTSKNMELIAVYKFEAGLT